jgi:FemAB-related protein (PEP-CTERM system-associated)
MINVVHEPIPERTAMNAIPVEVREVESAAEWDRFFDLRCGENLWFRSRWDAVFSTYRLPVIRLVACRGGEIVGALPLVAQPSRLFGRNLVSLPWFDAAGLVADDVETRGALVEAAVRLAADRGLERVILRQADPIEGWSVERDDKVVMRLTLEKDPDVLWKRFDPKVRNQVRKAEKSNLTAATGGAEYLDDFYRIYAVNMRDLGSPSHSRGFFEAVLANFPQEAKIHVVRLESMVIGAGLTLGNGPRLDIPWASSLQEFNRMCVNHLLYWHILRQACMDGYSSFNYGRSTKGSGQHHFKRQWGAEELPLFWYALDRAGACLVDSRPPQAEFGMAIRIWRRLPFWLTRWLGPRIIRQVS